MAAAGPRLVNSAPINLRGYLWKENRTFPGTKRRLFRLVGTILSCARNEDAGPKWEIDVLGATILDETKSSGAGGRIVVQAQSRRVGLVFRDSKTAGTWLAALKMASKMSVENYYTLGKQIGRGAYSRVRQGLTRATGEEVAVKVIDRNACPKEDLIFLEREMDIVRALDHPNIVKTYDVFETKSEVYIVLEYMPGGMLFDVIAMYGQFTERDAIGVMREMLEGLKYLHSKGVVHRDIKPENLLCTSPTWPLHVKWTDFGLSNMLGSGPGGGEALQTQVGTPHFAAPELLKNEPYSTPVDLWSCGVVLYNMLSGELPFDHPEDAGEIFRQILYSDIRFPTKLFGNISPHAISLIRGLLKRDPAQRLTAQSALNHAWFSERYDHKVAPILNDLSKLHSSQRLTSFSKNQRAHSTV
mmetsp:Transcript_2228/g.5020  ORF Transcript_2228/g.5020 Transcript_2228/m.5020 type:complete len:414 (-) Transcript_2228:26-1267(-)|eukprot:CAMPEP_0185847952 /NCGR_PEP_ID=MMETSP1354-20130828/3009_1 /TAXON_ID=708628 /ORGANISM="Erythrolobus madagascarensis, Strain CCMP3276" /LENGTH=413 /DNA_ID=CAMNT_0028548287 /DNA_START=435 /DNA_END=1676 /DNA_ORIENTATION=-